MASSCRNLVLHLQRTACSPWAHKSWIMRSFFNIFVIALTLASALSIPAIAATASADIAEKTAPTDKIATADEKLRTEIDTYWKTFPGRAGIAIYTPFSDEIIGKRQTERFPQQSVSKMWVALTILEQEAAGKLSLDKRIRVGRDDVVVFSQPLKNYLDGRDSFDMSLRELLTHSVMPATISPTTSFCALPEARKRSTTCLTAAKCNPFALVLAKSCCKARLPVWNGNQNIAKATHLKHNVQASRWAKGRLRSTPIWKHRSTARPPGTIALVLKRFSERDANDPGAKLLKLMAGTYTGRSRLRSGLAPGWRLAHKTGTGQVLESIATAINDVGVMIAPDGCVYPVAVMIAQTRAGSDVTNAFMQNIARAITRHHDYMHPKAKAAEAMPKPKPVAKAKKN